MANWYDNVPAPVDANGHEVPLDTKELVCRGETREVYCFVYNIGRDGWSVGFNGSCGAALSACTLPDSWEQLERDVRDTRDVKWSMAACRYFGHDTEDSCVGCQARSEDSCENAALYDILRRAKALAGVTDGE